MTPFVVWENESDEQNRRDRLARIYRDARRAEREPGARRSHLYSFAMFGLLIAALMIAGGCTRERVAPVVSHELAPAAYAYGPDWEPLKIKPAQTSPEMKVGGGGPLR